MSQNGVAAAGVLVTHEFPATVASMNGWEVWPGGGIMPREELMARVADLAGLLCMLVDGIDAELISAGSRLRVISQMAVGVDNIDLPAATAAGIAVGYTPGVLTETTADTAFALLASACRRLPEGQAILREGGVGEWDPAFLLGGDLADTTLGIVGLGRIGLAVARRAGGFGMRILYTGPRPKQEAAEVAARHVPFDELMASSDHVVVTAPLNSETRNLIGARAIARMGDGATLVNVARGGLVDHDALLAEAATGRIRVALDVTEPEPLPAEHPLLHLPNVLVVPHLGSASGRTRSAMAEMAIANLAAGLAGERLVACANPAVYDPS
ncbi:MAG: 2-hydroxyacid dehydrogenase [Acidimicrobiia bacterium]